MDIYGKVLAEFMLLDRLKTYEQFVKKQQNIQ